MKKLLLLLGMAVVLVGCRKPPAGIDNGSNGSEVVGKPLDIQFTATDGTKVDLAKMKGKVVLIDFWATWCGSVRGGATKC